MLDRHLENVPPPHTEVAECLTDKVVDLLYDEPVITRNKMTEVTGIKLTTINGIVNALLGKDIIKETTGYSRNQIFAFEKYKN